MSLDNIVVNMIPDELGSARKEDPTCSRSWQCRKPFLSMQWTTTNARACAQTRSPYGGNK